MDPWQLRATYLKRMLHLKVGRCQRRFDKGGRTGRALRGLFNDLLLGILGTKGGSKGGSGQSTKGTRRVMKDELGTRVAVMTAEDVTNKLETMKDENEYRKSEEQRAWRGRNPRKCGNSLGDAGMAHSSTAKKKMKCSQTEARSDRKEGRRGGWQG